MKHASSNTSGGADTAQTPTVPDQGVRPMPKPLDEGSAVERAHQIQALADPFRLRLLSLLSTTRDHRHTAETLAVEADASQMQTSNAIGALVAAGLVETSSTGTLAPSADAWIRFGRLLTQADGGPAAAHPASMHPAPMASLKLSLKAAPVIADHADRGPLPDIITRIADQLGHRFAGNFSPETVHRYVADTYYLLQDRANVTRFLPSQTSRFATDRLTALASARGVVLRRVPEVLFVCVHNGGRSQIAASILKQLAGDRVHVRSAGSAPGEAIDPQVIELLDEIGVSVAGEYPKPLTDEIVQASDFVVTMGCGDACPVYPGRQYVDWPIEDPVGQSADTVRMIRDDIHARVQDLMPQLGL